MNTKKPAQLGDNLLNIRPRKGQAKPQSEQQAYEAEATEERSVQQPKPRKSAPPKGLPRRRRRLSDKKIQLNLRVSEKSLERFTKIADDEGMIFGDLFAKLLDAYEGKQG